AAGLNQLALLGCCQGARLGKHDLEPLQRLGQTQTTYREFDSYSARVIPEATSFRRTACAHSSSILKYRATALVPTSKGCASPGWRSFSILSLVAAPLNWD